MVSKVVPSVTTFMVLTHTVCTLIELLCDSLAKGVKTDLQLLCAAQESQGRSTKIWSNKALIHCLNICLGLQEFSKVFNNFYLKITEYTYKNKKDHENHLNCKINYQREVIVKSLGV